MGSSITKLSILFCSILFLFSSTFTLENSFPTTPLNFNLSDITSFCISNPYPDVCFESLKHTNSVNISSNINNYVLQFLKDALSKGDKLTKLLSIAGSANIVEKQRGIIQACKDLHQITLSSLKKSVSIIQSGDSEKLADARAYISAALTNKNTCLEGLDSASGTLKPQLLKSLDSTYKHVSNSLSMLPKRDESEDGHDRRRRLLGFPSWMSRKDRRILQSNDDGYDIRDVLTVALDGTGNFSTITDAINFAPNNSNGKIIIFIKEGIYEENVEIPSYKTNIVLHGDGSNATVITGNKSVVDGWTTFRTATVAVLGERFLARDIAMVNHAGPEKHQAVALRVNADFAALYRCSINGYQNTLYVHSFRQFYRECDISGTIDYIFGNAAVVLQECNIISRMPLPGQFTVITAQSRDFPDENTGISIQNCFICAADELQGNSGKVKSYLGRPWKLYSTTVYLQSFIDDFIDPTGWIQWSNDQGLDTLYYGEYENNGPGSGTDNRVTWPGYHIMDDDAAYNFTVSEFITSEAWLDSTSIPYNDGFDRY